MRYVSKAAPQLISNPFFTPFFSKHKIAVQSQEMTRIRSYSHHRGSISSESRGPDGIPTRLADCMHDSKGTIVSTQYYSSPVGFWTRLGLQQY